MQYMDPLNQHHHQAPPQPAAQAQAQPQPQSQPQPQQQLPPHPAQPLPVLFQQQLPVMPQPQPPVAPMAATPSPAAVPVVNHPPYAQMITEAILALNEREGSSKRAIGKFIEQRYASANIPQGTHSVLLTSHLKKLKEQGIIVMVKHSYTLPNMVPRSEPAAATPTSNGGVKRRGRPPKPKTPASTAAEPAPQAPPPPATVTQNQNDVFASLGLSDGPVHVPVAADAASSGDGVKRGRGRPKKNVFGAPASLQPTGIIGKKSPGRPRKVAAKNAINSGGVAVAVHVAGPQQPRLKLDGTPAKPRGRKPKKIVSDVPTVQDTSAPAVTGGFLAPAVYVGEGAIVPAAASAPLPKRRGRPSLKVQNGSAQSARNNGPKIPRKLSGKPLGRPRKIASPSATQGPSGQPSYDEIRSQLDLLQSKVKESVNVLKPCLEGNANAGAVLALRELENVAGVAPVQQPPQQS